MFAEEVSVPCEIDKTHTELCRSALSPIALGKHRSNMPQVQGDSQGGQED